MCSLWCRAAGYEVVELNASDVRSKKSIVEATEEMISSKSLTQWYAPAPKGAPAPAAAAAAPKKQRGKTVLIMVWP